MARIAEKLSSPVVERLDLTRHFITFDCDFACYMVLNPSSADSLEGSDVVGIPIGSWQVDAWSFLTKEAYPNRAGFSAVFVYDAEKVNPPDTQTPSVRYSDVDIAHAVSGLRGQPVNITQFTCAEAMPVQITTPDKEPLTVSSQGIQYDPKSTFDTEKDVLDVSGLASELSAADKAVYASFLSDVKNHCYEIDLARLSLNARFGKELLRLYPSGVGSLVTLDGSSPSACIPFTPNRLVSEFGFDPVIKAGFEKAVSDAKKAVELDQGAIEHTQQVISDDRERLSGCNARYGSAVADNKAFVENDIVPSERMEAIKRDCWASWCSGASWSMPVLPVCVQFRVPASGETLAGRDSQVWGVLSKYLPDDVVDGLAQLDKADVPYRPRSPYTLAFNSNQRGKFSVTYLTDKGEVVSIGGYRKEDGTYSTFDLKDVLFEAFDEIMTCLGAWTSARFNADWWKKWVDNDIFHGSFADSSGPVKDYWAGYSSLSPSLEKAVSDALSDVLEAEKALDEDVKALADLEEDLDRDTKLVPVKEAELSAYLADSDSVILLRFILIYCYPYTAFKKDPTGASKVLCWKCGQSSQPVFTGSVQ